MELLLRHDTPTRISVFCNGEASHTFDMSSIPLPVSAQALPELTDSQAYGRAIYQSLFPPGVLARRVLDKEPERLLLVLTADDLDAVGWEYAYADDCDDYLVSSYHIVRGLPPDQRIPAQPLDESLHIVAIPSNPLSSQIAHLNIEGEWLRLRDIIGSLTNSCRLERARPPTLEQVRRLTANKHQQVVHFMGHGGRDERGAFLCFEQENGDLAPMTARECLLSLRETIFLITLNACESAAAGGRTSFDNLAAAFMRQKTPYALGMRLNIPDEDARTFSRTFYSELAGGTTVEEALRQARLKLMKSEHAWVVGVPVLYTALATPATGFPSMPGTPMIVEHQTPLEVSMLPRAGGVFQGRYDELKQLGSWLTGDSRKRIVTIHGGGGQGKTALAREAVERFAYAWSGVWAVSLEHLPDRAFFLTDLARYLNIPTQEILDIRDVERSVQEALRQRRVLIVLDNAETLVEAVLSTDVAAIDLAQLLQQLSTPSTSLLITSRVPLGWSGEELLELGGLAPKEGAELFIQGVVKRRREVEVVQAWQMSERLAGHPFGLRLLSTAFDYSLLSVGNLLQEYEAALLKTEDIYQHPDARHRTLAACLEVSTRYLETEPRIILSGLWIFHAPFLPETAVAIFDPACKESEQNQSSVRDHLQTLWERGLLLRQVVSTHEGSLLFYHLLPTTRPYVEQQMEQLYERETLLKRFGAVYAERAQRIHNQLDSSVIATVFAQQAREDFERGIAHTSGAEQGNYLLDWGWAVYRLGNLRRGLRYLEEAQEVAEGLDQRLELRTINALALIQNHVGLRHEALFQYQRILPIRQELQDREGEASTLSNMGFVYSNLGQPREALRYYEQALLIMRELSDRKAEATILNNIANVYDHLGRPEEALAYYQQTLTIEQESGNQRGEATTLNNMATVYSKTGQPQDALQLYQRALPMIQGMGDRAAEATTLANVAATLRVLGQLQEALHSYEYTLAIRQEIEDRPGEASDLNNIAAVYSGLGQAEQALQYYRLALSIRREINDRVGEASTLHNMAEVYRDTGQPREALRLYRQALPVRRASEDRAGEMATLNGIGHVYSNLGEPQEALRSYEEALPIARNIGNRAGEATIISNIALVYSNTGQPRQALALYEQALIVQRIVEDKIGEATTLDNMATVYGDVGELEEALHYYDQVLSIRHEVGDRSGEAVTLNNIGAAYRATGKLEEALLMYRQALPIMREVHNRVGEAATLNNIALIFKTVGQRQEALHMYEQALTIMREVEDRAAEAATLSNIGGVYKALGKHEEALVYYEQSLQLGRAVGDRASEATTLNSMGVLYREQGMQAEAVVYLEQSLLIRREIGDRVGEASTLSNLALVYSEVDRFPDALASCQQSLDISCKMKNQEGEAIALNNMALVHKRLGHLQEAFTLFEQSLPLMREVQQREGEATALNNMADILYTAGQLQEALVLYEQALTIMDELDAEERA